MSSGPGDAAPAVRLDSTLCNQCGNCLNSCPADVFATEPGKGVIARYPTDCFTCLLCIDDCPTNAIEVRLDVNGAGSRSIYDPK